MTPTTGTSRFPTLQSGEIDVLIRNTTHTFTRDTALGFDFAPITFYDGQGMMVRKDSGIASILDMDGATVCVQAGTTTEKNLADFFSANSIAYTRWSSPMRRAPWKPMTAAPATASRRTSPAWFPSSWT